MRRCLLFTFFLLSFLGCGPDEPFDYGESLQSVTNGTQTSGYPSVGIFRVSGAMCSATLISANAVLTARHCIMSSSGTFEVGGTTKTWNKAYKHGTSDVAVAILTSNSSVAPSPLRTSAPSVGTRLTIVGYGYSSPNGGAVGRKYVGYNNISSTNSTELRFRTSGSASALCHGDSGGPSFINSAIAGVHSWGSGSNPYCASSESGDMRVDVVASWVKQVAGIGDPPPPPPPPPSGGNTLTPNKYMYQNSYLQSNNGQWRFYIQDDGNLVLRAWPGTTVRWASGTNGKGGAKLILQSSDGNLVLYTSANSPVWASNTPNKGAVRLTITDSGTLALYNNSGGVVWSKPGSSMDIEDEEEQIFYEPDDQAGICADNANFIDAGGYACSDWIGYDCDRAVEDWSYTEEQEEDVKNNCAKSCHLCEEL